LQSAQGRVEATDFLIGSLLLTAAHAYEVKPRFRTQCKPVSRFCPEKRRPGMHAGSPMVGPHLA
jgi:hypothetical protein